MSIYIYIHLRLGYSPVNNVQIRSLNLGDVLPHHVLSVVVLHLGSQHGHQVVVRLSLVQRRNACIILTMQRLHISSTHAHKRSDMYRTYLIIGKKYCHLIGHISARILQQNTYFYG